MWPFVRKHKSATALSVSLHAAIVAALTLGVNFSSPRTPIAGQPAIEAVVVDQSLVDREIERLREIEQTKVREREREEQEARQAAEAARQEREREERALEEARQARERAEREERERQAEIVLQREREEAERVERERLAEFERQRQAEEERQREAQEAARREEERLAELERQRQEEERRRREAEEARQQAELEQELQVALAAEEEVRRARASGELDRYLLQIRSRIEANWIPPASAVAGLECVVNVTQIRTGDVVGVSVGRCNGDAAVRRSIENAVMRASPLPTPSIPALFERNLEVIFKPEF